MGCAQTKHSVNSPSGGVEKLKLDNGYAGIDGFIAHRRSVGQKRFVGKESSEAERPHGSGNDQFGSDNSELVDGWPKWLTSNIPKHVLAGLVPKSVEAYDKLDKVGQGSYSNVYKARDRETGKIVALKKVRFDTTEPESVKFMAREIMILLKLDHPNIVKLEGLATSRMQFSLYLVFDFMQTDLARVISHPDVRLTEPQVKCYMHQLLSGLKHCHDKGILHRDIKGSNLLIDKNGMLKIADFGLAIFFSPKRHLTNRVVTLWYRAPELLLGATEYGVGIDLWSAGCLFAEMFTGRPILPGRTEVEQLHKIFKLCGTPSEEYWRKLKLPPTFRPPQSYRPSLRESFKHFPSSSLGLLNTLLALEPSYRGSASSAIDNEFFYTSPLACSLSDLPIIHSDPDVLDKTNQQKSRNAKVTRRSHTHRERRRKDLTSGILKEESNLPKQLSQQRGDDDEQNEERGSTTTSTSSSVNNGVRKGSTMSSTSSGVNTGGRKTTSTSSSVNTGGETGSSHFLLSPISYSNRKSSRIQGHLQVTNNLNLPPLPKTREYSAYNIKDHGVTGLVRRSVSTRDFRNLERKEHLKLYAVDD
ncbi:putative serine/threonine-protein kinase [Cucumis melo var. makuwa]|uniref:Serine/threonine-protein kinase n=2 Tax=Cucumis melo TaxID=3656 RepID=A0A5D3D4H7_CUCMM|nr:putative serine/threonine-protein kinase [Cucumis melo var. makuwa]TYK18448.1 putative serine/threonine-protein kinase [Cucumis melo var. makuwa]